MRILNQCAVKQKGVRRVPGDPRMATMEVRGKRLVVDVFSLLAAEVTGDRYPAPSDLEPTFPPSPDAKVRVLVLNVTHGCNLACQYCYRRNYGQNEARPEHMKMDVVKRALRMLDYVPDRQNNPDVSISFFGGEPLVAFERVREIVQHVETMCAARGVRVRFSMTTNGTLITPDVAHFLNTHGFSLIVSLDGPPDVHNKYRPLVRGDFDSHAASLAGLERIKPLKAIKHVTLRSTFTGEGVDLAGRLEYLNALCDKGLAGHVSVEPVSLTEDGCLALPAGHALAITLKNLRQFLPEYDKAADWYVERIRSGKRAHFHHFTKMLERLATRGHAPSECGAGKAYRTVGPDGLVFACHREGGSHIGDVWSGIDEAKRAAWIDNRLYSRNRCPTCWARWICGGGCRMCSMDQHGNTVEPDAVGCWFKKVWIRRALWILSELTPEEVNLAIGRKGKGCGCG